MKHRWIGATTALMVAASMSIGSSAFAMREAALPAGSVLKVRLDNTIGSDRSQRGDVVGRPPSPREGALAHEDVRSPGQAGETLALDGVPGVDHRSAGRLHAERQAPRRVPGQRSLHHPAAPTGDVPTLLPEFGDL